MHENRKMYTNEQIIMKYDAFASTFYVHKKSSAVLIMVGESFLEQDWFGEVAAFPSDSYKRFFLAALPLGPPINTPPPLIQHMKFKKSLSHGISYAGASAFSPPLIKLPVHFAAAAKKKEGGTCVKALS